MSRRRSKPGWPRGGGTRGGGGAHAQQTRSQGQPSRFSAASGRRSPRFRTPCGCGRGRVAGVTTWIGPWVPAAGDAVQGGGRYRHPWGCRERGAAVDRRTAPPRPGAHSHGAPRDARRKGRPRTAPPSNARWDPADAAVAAAGRGEVETSPSCAAEHPSSDHRRRVGRRQSSARTRSRAGHGPGTRRGHRPCGCAARIAQGAEVGVAHLARVRQVGPRPAAAVEGNGRVGGRRRWRSRRRTCCAMQHEGLAHDHARSTNGARAGTPACRETRSTPVCASFLC